MILKPPTGANTKEVLVRYLECGDLHAGFARIRCDACGTERLLAYSCKRSYVCPSCHQKRAVQFGQWVCIQVLPAVPYRHFVFSVPKILRRLFVRDCSLLADLSRCGWHVLATDGAFYGKGMFRVSSRFRLKTLERLFRHKVLRMLLAKGKIAPETVRIMDRWRHCGFNVYRGPRIHPREKQSLERLAAYLIRSSFSQERMKYLPEEAQVRYQFSRPQDPGAPRPLARQRPAHAQGRCSAHSRCSARSLLLADPRFPRERVQPAPTCTVGL